MSIIPTTKPPQPKSRKNWNKSASLPSLTKDEILWWISGIHIPSLKHIEAKKKWRKAIKLVSQYEDELIDWAVLHDLPRKIHGGSKLFGKKGKKKWLLRYHLKETQDLFQYYFSSSQVYGKKATAQYIKHGGKVKGVTQVQRKGINTRNANAAKVCIYIFANMICN